MARTQDCASALLPFVPQCSPLSAWSPDPGARTLILALTLTLTPTLTLTRTLTLTLTQHCLLPRSPVPPCHLCRAGVTCVVWYHAVAQFDHKRAVGVLRRMVVPRPLMRVLLTLGSSPTFSQTFPSS